MHSVLALLLSGLGFLIWLASAASMLRPESLQTILALFALC